MWSGIVLDIYNIARDYLSYYDERKTHCTATENHVNAFLRIGEIISKIYESFYRENREYL